MAGKLFIKSEICTDESHVSDDSGTDNLYIDLEDVTKDEADASPVRKESNASRREAVSSVADSNRLPDQTAPTGYVSPYPAPPVITEYPRPFMPSFAVLPPTGSFYPPHPVFFPGMMPTPPYMPYPSPVFSHIPSPHQMPSYQADISGAPSLIGKVQGSPNSDGRVSPADSQSSSGVSNSPSPTRSSTEVSPKTPTPDKVTAEVNTKSPPTYTRTSGGRTCYTPDQVRALEQLFSENRYPDYDVLEKTSGDLGIPVKKVKVWFQNKRARNKSRSAVPSYYNMAAMMPAVPSPVMSLPYPVHPMVPSYQPYPFPGMLPPNKY